MHRARVIAIAVGAAASACGVDHPAASHECSPPSRTLLAQQEIEPPELDAAAAASVRDACIAGDAYACERLANGDVDELARALEPRCTAGDAAACAGYGALVRFRDAATAERALDRACTAKLPRACAILAGVLAHHRNTPQLSHDPEEGAWVDGKSLMDPDARALAAARAACDGGEARGCINLGVLHAAANDERASASAYRRGCDLGSPLACVDLAAACEHGTGVARDLFGAAALAQRACERGSSLGCANLALAYANGRGVPRDLSRAHALSARVCRETSAGWPDDQIAKAEACQLDAALAAAR